MEKGGGCFLQKRNGGVAGGSNNLVLAALGCSVVALALSIAALVVATTGDAAELARTISIVDGEVVVSGGLVVQQSSSSGRRM